MPERLFVIAALGLAAGGCGQQPASESKGGAAAERGQTQAPGAEAVQVSSVTFSRNPADAPRQLEAARAAAAAANAANARRQSGADQLDEGR